MQPDKIRRDAQNGTGHCKGCVAQKEQCGKWVNPGLFDPTSDLMFMTNECRHDPEWGENENWTEYNDPKHRRSFVAPKGRERISQMLEPFDYTLDDIWLSDSIKCPTEEVEKLGNPSVSESNAFNHCRKHLRDEIRNGGDWRLTVTLGAPATKRTHRVLGVSKNETDKIRVKEDYGKSKFNTTPPIVLAPHWSPQNGVSNHKWEHEIIPCVQKAMTDILIEGE